MTARPFDDPNLQRLIAAIRTTPPRPHHAALLAALGEHLPERRFRHALSRGGWYRPGGVIRPDGGGVADDLFTWAEEALAACGDDIELLLDRYRAEGLLVTRLSGHTHYFVSTVGAEPAAFLQLEVEELQEVVDRLLIDPDNPPADLSELTEPLHPTLLPVQAVGRPGYRFRRLTDVRQVLARQPAPLGELSPLGRFMAEWADSSAGADGHFSDHWIVALREHLDRYRNTIASATPVSRHARKLKPFHWQPDLRGTAMADQLHAFDRAAGHAGAWYFHLIAGGATPHAVAYAIAEDLVSDFHYLPERDQRLLVGWLNAPYAL